MVPEAVGSQNPFPGLRPFQEKEQHLFFGRENQVDTMVDTLRDTHFLAVVGSSGSGKSSLVNCGLQPALRRGLMAGVGTAWRIAKFRPGGNPIGSLVAALAEPGVLFSDFEASGLTLAEIIEPTLTMSKVGLVDIYEQARLEDAKLLVIVDQFEELFRYRNLGELGTHHVGVSEDVTQFVKLLLEARHNPNIYIVLTMRSDFLGDCTVFSELPETINKGQYLVPRMTRSEQRSAIEGPVAVEGGEISPVLLTRLVNDVGDNPDQLSILQHALNRTWDRWGLKEGPLDLEHYEGIGTMVRALDAHADEAFGSLESDREKEICTGIFKALTDRVTDPRGIRRPTKFGDLCELTESSPDEVQHVIDVFRDPSRSFLMPPLKRPQPTSARAMGSNTLGDGDQDATGTERDVNRLTADTVIDISHESLMRVWDRLKGWAEEEAISASTYKRLAETAALEMQGKADLWRGADLTMALEWRRTAKPTKLWTEHLGLSPGATGGGTAEFDDAMDFVDRSEAKREADLREEEEARQDKMRHAEELTRQEEQAKAQEKEARVARTQAAESKKQARRFRRVSKVAAVLAVAGAIAATFAIVQSIQAGAARNQAEQQSVIAGEQADSAVAARLQATRQLAIANEQTGIANAERERAVRATAVAERASADAQEQTGIANAERERATDEARSAAAALLALASVDSLDTDPEFAYLVALAAVYVARNDQTVGALRRAMDTSRVVKVLTPSGTVPSGFTTALHATLRSALLGADVPEWPTDDGLTIRDDSSGYELRLTSPGDGGNVNLSGDGRTRPFPPVHRDDPTSAAFGRRPGASDAPPSIVITGSPDGTAVLWDIAGEAPVQRETLPHEFAVQSVTISLCGARAATGAVDGTVTLWDAYGGRELNTIVNAHAGTVNALEFLACGERMQLLTAGGDGIVKLWSWNADTPGEVTELVLRGHDSAVVAVAGDETLQLAASASADGTLRIWNLNQAPVGEKTVEELLDLANTPVSDLAEADLGRQPRPLFEVSASACEDEELDLEERLSSLEVQPPPLFCPFQLGTTEPPGADPVQR